MQQQEPIGKAAASAASPQEIAKLQTQRNGGAGWFYAIAGFSIINLVILAAGGGVNFLIGLGTTQLIDVLCMTLAEQMEHPAGVVVRIVGGAVTVVIACLFLLFGFFARRGHWPVFIGGMVLYAIDGLIFLWFQDWLSFGFHIFALFALSGGLKAQFQLDQIERRSQMAEIFSPDRNDPPGDVEAAGAAE